MKADAKGGIQKGWINNPTPPCRFSPPIPSISRCFQVPTTSQSGVIRHESRAFEPRGQSITQATGEIIGPRRVPLRSTACPERALRVERVSFVVKGFAFSDPRSSALISGKLLLAHSVLSYVPTTSQSGVIRHESRVLNRAAINNVSAGEIIGPRRVPLRSFVVKGFAFSDPRSSALISGKFLLFRSHGR